MTWLKVDDKITTHPKWLPLTIEAKSLWFHAAVWVAAHNNDGQIPDEALALIAFTASVQPHVVDDSTGRLVKAGLWLRRAKSKGGGFEIHNWLDYQPSRQQVKERADADDRREEKKRLHDWLHKKTVGKRVKQLIDARDGLFCRYCAEQTVITPGDRRGPHRRTYDLIDPDSRWDTDATALDEVEIERIAQLWAVACGWCNAVKAMRTPDDAGMQLLPPPTRGRGILPRSVANGSGTVPELGTGLAVPDLAGSGRPSTGRGRGRPDDPAPPHDDVHFPGDAA